MITVYHIPVCPFCQRLEILLELKGAHDEVRFEVVDITKPRDPELLKKTDGTTALPVLETHDGRILKESLVLLDYLDSLFGPKVARDDPYERAVEQMLVAKESPFVMQGYRFVMNQDLDRRDEFRDGMLEYYADLDAFLRKHNPDGTWLFDEFGYAEAVYTPFFQRFWFLEYYEDFDLPAEARFERVRRWRDACLEHPAAQQTSREEIVKVYYDYALGAGNGALLEGRQRSSFVFEPHWKERPWPPKDKYGRSASDEELGLL
jgi:glutathione S-transferase